MDEQQLPGDPTQSVLEQCLQMRVERPLGSRLQSSYCRSHLNGIWVLLSSSWGPSQPHLLVRLYVPEEGVLLGMYVSTPGIDCTPHCFVFIY